MKMINLTHTILMLSAISCGKHTNSSGTSAIVGADTRRPNTEESLQKALGTIILSEKSICTAFVSGPGEITTASHCLSGSLTDFKFKTFDGTKFDIVAVIDNKPNADTIRLKCGVPDSSLQLGIFAPDTITTLAALDSATEKLVTTTVGHAELSQGIIYHTLDSLPGASGGALIQNNKIVGMHLGSVSPSKNVGVALHSLDEVDVSNLDIQAEGCNPFGTRSQRRACNIPTPSGSQNMTVCGYSFKVPVLSYTACQIGAALLPPNCTAVAAATGGGSCAANFAAVSAACVVSVATVASAASCCISGGC